MREVNFYFVILPPSAMVDTGHEAMFYSQVSSVQLGLLLLIAFRAPDMDSALSTSACNAVQDNSEGD